MLKKLAISLIALLALAYLSLAYGVPWLINRPAAPLDPSPEVTLTTGVATGGWANEGKTIAVYNGLPYAAPPVGQMRWQPPADPPAWTDTRDARTFGAECLQYRDGIQRFIKAFIAGHGLPGWKQWLAARVVAAAPAPIESEDCLYLNVRTDNVGSSDLKPVMVWFHGGSHQTGAGSDEFYQADGLVYNGVVLVTINYRLGPFGYLAHPALTADSANNSSGNYGLMDQIKSLEWVRDNIAAFGGDPNNVTIFGESAGAQSVSEVMAAPMGNGLYHKAILQSGSSTYNRIHLSTEIDTTRSAEAVGEEFLSTLLPAGGSSSASDLRQISGADLVARMAETEDLAPYFLPNVDGYVLPRMIGDVIRDGSAITVPVLGGYNADEGTLFYNPALGKPTVLVPGAFPATYEERVAKLEEIYGAEFAAELVELYDLTSAEAWDKGATDMLGDDIFGLHMRYLAKATAAKGLPSWLYFFSRTPASPKQTLGAFHASELAFVFDSHNDFLEANEADFALGHIMGKYWTNFAKTGNPNGPDVPEWPAYTAQSDAWMHLKHRPEAETGIRRAKLDIMEATLETKLTESLTLSPTAQRVALSNEEPLADSLQP